MRVLLDECIPRGLRRELSGHEVRTVPEMGWASRKNGELLRLAVEAAFDVFVTMDIVSTEKKCLTGKNNEKTMGGVLRRPRAGARRPDRPPRAPRRKKGLQPPYKLSRWGSRSGITRFASRNSQGSS